MNEIISIESVSFARNGYQTSHRPSRGCARFPQNPFFFLIFSGFERRDGKTGKDCANKHHHATVKNARRDQLRVKNYSFYVTYVSSGPGGFVSPVSSTFLRHCFSFLFKCVNVRSFRAKKCCAAFCNLGSRHKTLNF